jgi:uncharacterized protein YggT (Ycf19 family)
MELGTFDLLFNILLLVFWFRIWTGGDSRLFFNPYLAPISRVTESIFAFLWPVFRRTPRSLLAIILVILLLAFRGLMIPSATIWTLTFGFEHQICPQPLQYHMVFSVLSFCIFLFKVWGFSLIFVRTRLGPFDHAWDTLYRLSLPFSNLKAELRPLALAPFGVLLAFLLNLAGGLAQSDAALLGLAKPSLFLKYFISAFACWASVLPVLATLLVVFIIGSWISLFSSFSRLGFLCREWLDMLLGPLRNYPIRIGMLDLTPLVLIFVIQWLYPFLVNVLYTSYGRLG